MMRKMAIRADHSASALLAYTATGSVSSGAVAAMAVDVATGSVVVSAVADRGP
jgi:hypothetical protein